MQTLRHPAMQSSLASGSIAIAATFTAEPVEDSLGFWMQHLGLSTPVEFAPYNQVFQQLLDPTSQFAQNKAGLNVILLRFEDWCRDQSGDPITAIEQNIQGLIAALQTATARSATPYLICLCPDSPQRDADPNWARQRWQDQLTAALGGSQGIHWVEAAAFELYPVSDYYDPQRDQLGHIPFTPQFYAALGTLIARRLYAIKRPPHKVIVLDCDNTIWKGVVGEDGVMGVEVTPAYKFLQAFMVAQQKAGMILCFCSKNNEADVLEVFEKRPELPLQLEHLVAWRINWLPKSENLKALAQELNLGLDSFIFLDDNPMECAEVKLSCPEVLTIQLPADGDIPQFLKHIWAFDRLTVTEEDKQRTNLYRQNAERERFQQQVVSLEDFLAGLNLHVEISEPTAAQLPRIAQLTQRTNQFNFTTVRRSDGEIQQLAQAGLDCRAVEVRDRFGDYGLVGVMIFGCADRALTVDTFLLSCRVLGRGVEHQMLNYLAKLAEAQQLEQLNLDFMPTKKNLPALTFVESVAADFKQPAAEQGSRFAIPVATAVTIAYQPGAVAQAPAESAEPATGPAKPANIATQIDKSLLLSQIAAQFNQVEQILPAITAQKQPTARSATQAYVAPRSLTETDLARLWAELLNLDQVGVEDNYFDLGGTSLLSVELVARIASQFGRKLPLTAVVGAPTVAELARLLNQSEEMESLVLLRAGSSKPPLFLIHDGDGETLLYRNLANRLHSDYPVYGLQPHASAEAPMLHSRIPEMAAFYIEKIQSVQLHGPYLVGGMCAGGVIAFEVAQQLQQQGELVALVALLDAADVAAPKRIGRIANQRFQRFSSSLGQEPQQSLPQRVGTIVAKASRKLTNLAIYETQSRFTKLYRAFQLRAFQFYRDRGLALPAYLQNLSVRQVYEFAERQHSPEGQFEGKVLLLRATTGTSGDEPWIDVYSDPFFGWEQRVTQEVKAYDIPGGHSSMLQEPNVALMAERLQSYIDAALENATVAPTHLAVADELSTLPS